MQILKKLPIILTKDKVFMDSLKSKKFEQGDIVLLPEDAIIVDTTLDEVVIEHRPIKVEKKTGTKTTVFAKKDCCGSRGPRHMKDCSNHPGNTVAARTPEAERERAWREYTAPISIDRYSDIKDLQEDGVTTVGTMSSLNIPVDMMDEVNFVYESKGYEGYVVLSRRKAFGG